MKPVILKSAMLWSLLAAAVLTAAFFLWNDGFFLTAGSPWSVWTAEKTEEDVCGDREYRICLRDRHIRVFSAAQTEAYEMTWESPAHLRVQDFLFCDIDHDKALELMILCWYIGEPALWKSGQPVIAGRQWVQHIYIYKPIADGSMHDHWMASRIMRNVASWAFDDALRLSLTDQNGEVTRWDWFGWGLKHFA